MVPRGVSSPLKKKTPPHFELPPSTDYQRKLPPLPTPENLLGTLFHFYRVRNELQAFIFQIFQKIAGEKYIIFPERGSENYILFPEN